MGTAFIKFKQSAVQWGSNKPQKDHTFVDQITLHLLNIKNI